MGVEQGAKCFKICSPITDFFAGRGDFEETNDA
jgi:hypothetical protein